MKDGSEVRFIQEWIKDGLFVSEANLKVRTGSVGEDRGPTLGSGVRFILRNG